MNVVLAVCLLIDLAIPFTISIPYKGYSHTHQVMSVLGCPQSPLGRVYNCWMVVSGAAVCAVGIVLYQRFVPVNQGLALALMILLLCYGICDEIVSGFFPLSEDKRTVTLASRIHGAGSVIGFIALLPAPLLFGLLLMQAGAGVWGMLSVIAFALTFLSFCAFIMGDKPRFAATLLGLEGLWQRLICLFAYLPFIGFLLAL